MRPQLQTTGADAEDTGEKLIGVKEVRGMKILRQVWELFTQISRFLSDVLAQRSEIITLILTQEEVRVFFSQMPFSQTH